MRIDGATAASPAQQSESRFEQVMSRELARSSSGKAPAETNIRTGLAASSKRTAPASERVGASFKDTQAGKILKGMQDSTRNALTKAMTQTTDAARTAMATLGKAADTLMSKAEGFRDSAMAQAFGKDGATGKMMGDASGKAGAGLEGGIAKQPGEASSARSPAMASGTQNGPLSGPATATNTSTSPASSSAPGAGTQAGLTTALRTDGPVITTGAERTAAPALTEAGGPAPTTTTTGTVADGAGVQEGRAALALQEAPTTQEAFLLLSPGLQGVARRAGENGSTLSMVYMLAPNDHGAEFVSITTDDRGFITGPAVDIALDDGTVDTEGNWVALAGEGTVGGTRVMLEPDRDGCVFVTDGVDGVPRRIRAWIKDGDAIQADVIAVQKIA